jgi:hypothetical protein
MPGAKNFCFTLNNYTDEDLTRIDDLIKGDKRICYLIYGKEVGSEGTPHLQGFISFTTKKRWLDVKAIIGGEPHVEVSRNVMASIQYCKKEGDFKEFGSRQAGQGKRGDLDEFKKAVKSKEIRTLRDAREKFSEIYAKYPRFCVEYLQDNQPEVQIEDHPLRPWQQHVVQLLDEEPDGRKIIFLVDELGNSGKSWFANYYNKLKGDTCQVLVPAKKADIAYALRSGLKYIFLDAPRSQQGVHIQYDLLEQLKSGQVFSPKYESRMKTFQNLHVVVNLNESPDFTKLSRDRYHVINIVDMEAITLETIPINRIIF